MLGRAASELAAIDRKIEDARILGSAVFEETPETLEAMMLRERIWNKSVNERKSLEVPRSAALQAVEKARESFAEARGERLALERLRENRHGQWKQECKREESKVLDEQVNNSARIRLLRGGDV